MRTALVACILRIAPVAFSMEVGTPGDLNTAVTSIAGSESIVLTTSITEPNERNWEINVGDPNTYSVTIDTNGNTLTMKDNWTIKGPDTTTTYLNGTFIAEGTEFGLLGGTYIFAPSSSVRVEGTANLFVDADGGNVTFDNSFMSATNLTIGDAFNPEAGSLTVTNGGRVAVDIAGVVHGSGSMTIAGTGSQARFGQELNVGQGGASGTSASFSVLDGGSVTVAGGLRISPDFLNQGHVLIAGAGSLLSLTGTLSGSLGGSADGTLEVRDGGVVRLTGASAAPSNFAIAMAGTATIGNGGRLELLSGPGGERVGIVLSGSSAGSFIVGKGGVVRSESGRIQGNSLDFAADSRYEVHVDGTRADSLIADTTSLTIDPSAQLDVRIANHAQYKLNAAATEYVILEKLGGIPSDTFLINDTATLRRNFFWNGADGVLSIQRYATYADVLQAANADWNALQPAAALDALLASSPGNSGLESVFAALDGSASAAALRSAANNLRADILADGLLRSHEDAAGFRTTVRRLLSSRPAWDAPECGAGRMWATYTGFHNRTRGDGEAGGTYRSNGIAMGWEYRRPDARYGLAAGYSHARIAYRTLPMKDKANSFHAGLYAGVRRDDFHFDSLAAYTASWRRPRRGNFGRQEHASFRDDVWHGYGRIGYDAVVSEWGRVTPEAGIAVAYATRSSGRESGTGLLPYGWDDADYCTVDVPVGIAWSNAFAGGEWLYEPTVAARYAFHAGADRANVGMYFQSDPAIHFQNRTAARGTGRMELSALVKACWGSRMEGEIGYAFSIGKGWRGHIFSANLGLMF